MADDPVIELARRKRGEVKHTRETVSPEIGDRLSALEQQVQALSEALAGAAADKAQLMDICRALDDRISSFGIKVEKVEAAA